MVAHCALRHSEGPFCGQESLSVQCVRGRRPAPGLHPAQALRRTGLLPREVRWPLHVCRQPQTLAAGSSTSPVSAV